MNSSTPWPHPTTPRTPPLTAASLQSLVEKNKFARWFANDAGELLELRIAPIQPSEDFDRITPPGGWLVAARCWNDDHLARVTSILGGEARIVAGTSPAPYVPDFSALDWRRFTGVYLDYYLDRPALHCVCSDHYRSMIALLQELHRRGYRRPGLFMEVLLDERLQYRWEGAFLALQSYLPDTEILPPLLLSEISREAVTAWFEQHRPDVLIGHESDALDWIRATGVRIPEDHGFVCLNSLRAPVGVTALDFQADQLGARATEFVTAQLLQNEFGAPTEPFLTTLTAKLVEGTTVLPRVPYRSIPARTRRPRPAKSPSTKSA